MDESLSDFQEAKQSCKGPKPVTKPSKPKTRKVTKRIKGQKDIRTALKGKKNELEAYTKEFDNVCKKSGLDVDSEQLQLAIALSKSLQTEANENENTSTLTSQQRVANIRKTLQEYGFKVPEAKITAVKKARKLKKIYKLLTMPEEEKHQIITSKYTQVLFENLDKSIIEQNCEDLNARVFHIASNILYECMKDDSIFYVDSLVERSKSNGSLLRDWSEIPGRPVSPKPEAPNTMDFKDIDCSQNELDVILSGSIKSVKDILDSKYSKLKNNAPCIIINDEDKCNNKMDSSIISIDDNHEVETINKSPFEKAFGLQSPIKKVGPKTPVKRLFNDESCVSDVIEITSPKVENKDCKVLNIESKLKVTEPCRSVSPDIFDDELSSIIDVSKPINILSQEHKTKVFSQDNYMDLTQCANVVSQNSEKSALLSQDVTKRKSNDFMEITECVVGSSQPIREELKEIDLTQSPEANNTIRGGNNSINVDNNLDKVSVNISNDVEQETSDSVSQNITDEQNVTVVPNERINMDKEDNVDLTQSSNEGDGNMEVIDDNNEARGKNAGESINLTQSSNSDDLDGLPSVNFGDSHAQTYLDDTIIVDPVDYISNGKVKQSTLLGNRAQSPVCDLTQEQEAESDSNPVLAKNNEPCTSFYEDFVHEHSESDISKEIEQNVRNKDDSNNVLREEETDDIDLTQSSDTTEEISNHIESDKNIFNNSSLGKNGDISIDYDEIDTEDNSYNTVSLKDNEKNDSMTQKSEDNHIHIIDENDEALNTSQNSEVFHISDKELDYSLHKSRFELPKDNFDFGGISVLNNITRLDGTRNLSEIGQRISVANENGVDSLPEIKFGNENEKGIDKTELHVNMDITSEEFQDVLANTNGVINVKTPNKSEYVIKTGDVTPMADYASMSTPERNRELDKYGLKPFKRKRAIKILTHIYNQMHPTIQQLVDEDQPSCKKPRLTLTQDSSPKKFAKSPTKSSQIIPKKSPLKILNGIAHCSHTNSDEIERDRCIQSAPTSKVDEKSSEVCDYEVSNEFAIVKTIDCNPDDWVFQKREKAKVHSCRVPLHIAFHNYVLSRRSLREAILKYEPVNIDVIHKDLVGYGHRYDPKELLKFLDKRCITVKTTDNNARNNRR
ncbi:unnamed protein product [Spodoptera exigua]|nr:unnamed protein product [Spodoptera exigua]